MENALNLIKQLPDIYALKYLGFLCSHLPTATIKTFGIMFKINILIGKNNPESIIGDLKSIMHCRQLRTTFGLGLCRFCQQNFGGYKQRAKILEK